MNQPTNDRTPHGKLLAQIRQAADEVSRVVARLLPKLAEERQVTGLDIGTDRWHAPSRNAEVEYLRGGNITPAASLPLDRLNPPVSLKLNKSYR
jgi:hypothetical protein